MKKYYSKNEVKALISEFISDSTLHQKGNRRDIYKNAIGRLGRSCCISAVYHATKPDNDHDNKHKKKVVDAFMKESNHPKNPWKMDEGSNHTMVRRVLHHLGHDYKDIDPSIYKRNKYGEKRTTGFMSANELGEKHPDKNMIVYTHDVSDPWSPLPTGHAFNVKHGKVYDRHKLSSHGHDELYHADHVIKRKHGGVNEDNRMKKYYTREELKSMIESLHDSIRQSANDNKKYDNSTKAILGRFAHHLGETLYHRNSMGKISEMKHQMILRHGFDDYNHIHENLSKLQFYHSKMKDHHEYLTGVHLHAMENKRKTGKAYSEDTLWGIRHHQNEISSYEKTARDLRRSTYAEYAKAMKERPKRLKVVEDMDGSERESTLKKMAEHRKHMTLCHIASDIADNMGNDRLSNEYIRGWEKHGKAFDSHEHSLEYPEDWIKQHANIMSKVAHDHTHFLKKSMNPPHDEIMNRARKIMKDDEERRENLSPRTMRGSNRRRFR